ncbi:MAG: hypothetical protein IJW15_00525 [Clostridia bacterium]|nr:hypothetical protein [Clostridia bacterium]
MKKRKSQEETKPTFKERMADGFDASKEMILDVPKIVFIGNREAVIENYKCITDYTETLIMLDAEPAAVRLSGKCLEIKSISREMLFVSGDIEKMEFVKGE